MAAVVFRWLTVLNVFVICVSINRIITVIITLFGVPWQQLLVCLPRLVWTRVEPPPKNVVVHVLKTDILCMFKPYWLFVITYLSYTSCGPVSLEPTRPPARCRQALLTRPGPEPKAPRLASLEETSDVFVLEGLGQYVG